jgi:hypothetical protein
MLGLGVLAAAEEQQGGGIIEAQAQRRGREREERRRGSHLQLLNCWVLLRTYLMGRSYSLVDPTFGPSQNVKCKVSKD